MIKVADKLIEREKDISELISSAIEKGTNLVLIHSDFLSDIFFDLSSGLAGDLLQKLINYHVKAAIVLPDESKLSIRMKELLQELNKGTQIRSFKKVEEAKEWLSSIK